MAQRHYSDSPYDSHYPNQQQPWAGQHRAFDAPPSPGYNPQRDMAYQQQQQPWPGQHAPDPYYDEPLLPPNRGAYALAPRPGSAASDHTAVGAGVGGNKAAWGSRASLASTADAAHNNNAGEYRPYPRSADDYVSKEALVAGPGKRKGSGRGRRWALGTAALVLVLAAAAGAAIYFFVVRPRHAASASSAGAASNSTAGAAPGIASGGTVLISGGDGSTVTSETGTFVYNSSFGGYWYADPKDAYGAGGKANAWTPASNETWTWGAVRVNGVNLGGWLVVEPFINPNLFEPYQTGAIQAVDEWTLSEAMAADTANGGLSQMETHYKTFITEQDFAQIAGAGLNFVRIPLPFWAIGKMSTEPFLEHVSWGYFLKAIAWARKYGLRINLDLHCLPGSQNGWNHSGRLGSINFLNGTMGLVNAQRGLDYIRTLAEFIAQPQYSGVVPMFGIANEPHFDGGSPGMDIFDIKNFYYKAYTMIRGLSGLGNGPLISMFLGFQTDVTKWAGFLAGADRVALDNHPYTIFGGQPSNAEGTAYIGIPCNGTAGWGAFMNASREQFGWIGAGEFSAAINDCGQWISAVGVESRYETKFGTGSCDEWLNYEAYSATRTAGLQTFVKAQMDSLQDYFFWTWKIAPSSQTNAIMAPFWSYSLGLAQGWIPWDPRTAAGTCAGNGYPQPAPFDGVFQPAQTGGPGAVLTPATTEPYQWPPATIASAGPATLLPSYTPTGVMTTLPPATATPLPSGAGSGWYGKPDTAGAYVPIAGCTYYDNYDVYQLPVPTLCPAPA